MFFLPNLAQQTWLSAIDNNFQGHPKILGSLTVGSNTSNAEPQRVWHKLRWLCLVKKKKEKEGDI